MEGYYFVPDCEFVEKEYTCLFNEDQRKDMTLDEKCKKVIDLFNDGDHFIAVEFGEGVNHDLCMYNRINDRGDNCFSYDNENEDWTDEKDLNVGNWKKFSERKKHNYVDWITEGKIEPTETFCKHHFLGKGWMIQLQPDVESNDEYYDAEYCSMGLSVIMDKCIDLTSKYMNKNEQLSSKNMKQFRKIQELEKSNDLLLKENFESFVKITKAKDEKHQKKGKKCKKAKKWNKLIQAIKENQDNEDYCIWDTLEELGVSANGEDA